MFEFVSKIYCDLLRTAGSGGHVARMGGRGGVYRVLVGKHEGKGQLGRHWRRREDNIKMDLHGSGMWGVWTGSSWPRIETGGGHL